MPEDRELDTFRRRLPEMLRDHEREFVLIKGDRVEGFWKTKEEAYRAAHERFPLQPFFVKQVQRAEECLILSPRLTRACPP
jgi:hypothetical protein